MEPPPSHQGTKGAVWPGENYAPPPAPHTSQGTGQGAGEGGLSLPQAPRSGCRAAGAPCKAQLMVESEGAERT